MILPATLFLAWTAQYSTYHAYSTLRLQQSPGSLLDYVSVLYYALVLFVAIRAAVFTVHSLLFLALRTFLIIIMLVVLYETCSIWKSELCSGATPHDLI